MLVTRIFSSASAELRQPLFLTRVPAGFPSPADDYMEGNLDLNTHLIKHTSATFFVRVVGDSMKDAGIHTGDILVVDRSLEAGDNTIATCETAGQKTLLTSQNIYTIICFTHYSTS
jgi:DNA polymerase V